MLLESAEIWRKKEIRIWLDCGKSCCTQVTDAYTVFASKGDMETIRSATFFHFSCFYVSCYRMIFRLIGPSPPPRPPPPKKRIDKIQYDTMIK